MFCKTALVTLALTLLTEASPIVQTNGSRIFLSKRGELTHENGTFNHDKAIQHSVHIHNKYRQNMINVQNNEGPEALNEGAEIRPVMNYHDHERRQAEPLTDEEDDVEWAGTVSIGTPGQTFLIDFDTGSSDLWVPSVGCTSSACSAKTKYNPASSSSDTKQSGNFQISYADGSAVQGPIYTDKVTVAGISATKQYFSAVTQMTRNFAQNPIDGIMGLGFPSLSSLRRDPFFTTAFKQGAVQTNAFAMKLAETCSELYLGGANPARYTGAIEYHAVGGPGFWQVLNGKASVNGKTVTSNIQTIIDSGTSLMYGPPVDVASFYRNVPGSKSVDRRNGIYSFPCSAPPSAVFNWGGRDWPVSADNFNLGPTENDPSQCVGALFGQDLGLGRGIWLLGDAFMKNQYNVFSFAQKSVGFATLSS